ncbi:MAG: substrate-binding domain-containing protein, partial [Pygmaiobacter sp.]
TSYISARRYDGCAEAFAAHHAAFGAADYEKANYNYGSAYRAMSRLMERYQEMTAVFCMSDIMAIGAIRAIRDHGLLVPRDISVIGFDGIELAQYCDPKLATICQPGREIAHKSVELLISQIKKGTAAQTIEVGVTLAEGDSVRDL